ncbi:MAG TPA: S8 family serine peptidase, partial [Solirubrobacteraceae bacterium]|nr:S8 family serine peptidase [Solirubrobacteraceae bacterium]
LRQPTQEPPGTAEDAALGGLTGGGASYLRLPTGLWQRLGGVEHAGEGVIVGVIDTGIAPEHPSFADGPPAYAPPEVWNGACQGGDGFPVSTCNNKLVGARYFVDGFGRDALEDGSSVSPRDEDGHGTHTASTAAGNYGVDPVIDGNGLGVDLISGIAPRAHVAAYKACWTGTEVSGCADSDLVAAIDAAVADGVDVLNYSIGTETPSVVSPDSVAFFGAVDAGVFVAASAGNNGPEASTVGTPASVPWLTSVAAATTRRAFEATLTVSSPQGPLEVRGASVGRGLPATRLVDGAASGLPDVDPAEAAECLGGVLDPAKVLGAVVLCVGNRMRAARGRAVEEAGGAGMILANPEGAATLLTDNHPIPTVHIGHEDGLRVKALIGPEATAEIGAGQAVALPRGGVLADFSSRGPQDAVPDIGKPDLTAPGVQILAGAAPELLPSSPFMPGQLFQVISGTSMSAPHVAGAAALLEQLHPLFTPAETKSALMTTANPDVLLEDGVTAATSFDAGAGEIDPNRAADPGLVLDVTSLEYLRYLEAVDPDIVSGALPPLQPTDLNVPSIVMSDVLVEQQTARTFRSVEPRTTRWTVTADSPQGIALTPSPRRFTLRAGEEQTVELTVQVADRDSPAYGAGGLVLTSGDRRVRLPVQVRVRAVMAPELVDLTAEAEAGSAPVTVTAGLTGELRGLGWGLAAPDTLVGESVTATTGQVDLSGTDPGTNLYPLTVPEGAQAIGGRISNADGGAAGTDLDLYLYRDPDADGDFTNAELVDFENDLDSDENVLVPLPRPGEYVYAVLGFSTRDPVSTYDFTTWVVDDPQPDDPAPPPGLVVSGDPVATQAGEPATFSVDWSGLTEPGTYLGLVTYHDSAEPTRENVRGASLVRLQRTGAAPGP